MRTSRFQDLLTCPRCRAGDLHFDDARVRCARCEVDYESIDGVPILIDRDSPVLDWFEPAGAKAASRADAVRLALERIYNFLKPEPRVWTRRSIRQIQRLLEARKPDDEGINVVLVGAGFEKVYRRLLKPFQEVIRIGLPHDGGVDVMCDVCNIPMESDSLDVVMSASVLEHVYDPESAVEEMHRVLKVGGMVYAEIPFMRAYHMIPVDYQRYTISGIEELFRRHGFSLIDKGICSGPFTASVLFVVDFMKSVFSFNKYTSGLAVLVTSVLLHPLKYLDRLFEDSRWAEINACNFYYVGRKT